MKLVRHFKGTNGSDFADDITYRPVDPEKDLGVAYAIFKRTIMASVVALNNGIWPEEERRPFFKKGFKDDGMSMLLHKGKKIGIFCITELDLPVINEPEIIIKNENDVESFNTRPTYRAVILQRMYIDSDYQGKGIGKILMDAALEEAHKKHLPLELEVLANNDNAIRTYKKNGYEIYSRIDKGWNKKFLMRQKETEQYMPYRTLANRAPRTDFNL